MSQFGPGVLSANLQKLGLERGLLGIDHPGYVVVDFTPLKSVGRLYHNSIAKDAYAPPGIVPLFITLFANISK